MAKRPTSRSHADDTSATPGSPKSRRSRSSKENAATPPGAPLPPSDTHAARAEATDERPIDLDPGPRPESLDALTSASTSMASEPSEQDIRMRAYQRYLERGGNQGGEFDDWVEAERELKTRR